MNSATSVFFTDTATTRGMPNTRRRVSITTDRMLEEPCEATSLMHGFEAERRGRPLRLGNQIQGGVVLSCYTQELSWMAHFLVSLRCPLVVREPPELHEALRTLAAEIAQLAERSEERYVERGEA